MYITLTGRNDLKGGKKGKQKSRHLLAGEVSGFLGGNVCLSYFKMKHSALPFVSLPAEMLA